jgi:hypothetical protein
VQTVQGYVRDSEMFEDHAGDGLPASDGRRPSRKIEQTRRGGPRFSPPALLTGCQSRRDREQIDDVLLSLVAEVHRGMLAQGRDDVARQLGAEIR